MPSRRSSLAMFWSYWPNSRDAKRLSSKASVSSAFCPSDATKGSAGARGGGSALRSFSTRAAAALRSGDDFNLTPRAFMKAASCQAAEQRIGSGRDDVDLADFTDECLGAID